MVYPKVNQGLVLDETYWDEMYGDTYNVDGLFNAKEHAKYAASIFQLMDTKVQSLGDFGFGKGALFKEFTKVFKPARVIGVEPSPERVEEIRGQAWIEKTHIQIHNTSLQEFNPPYLSYAPLDLGICNSVFQYIPDKDLKSIVKKLASFCRFLYFTVPTDKDYKRMKKDIAFVDPYAFSRSVQFYRKLLSPYFHFVSFNLLESKTKINPLVFEEEFFRF
jgi:trans-aconitate methyltransferase